MDKKQTIEAGNSLPPPLGSVLELTDDDINLIDKCLENCESNLDSAANGYTNLFKMACAYTKGRIAEVRAKLKPNKCRDARREGEKYNG